MVAKERKIIYDVGLKLQHIVKYDNKNLKNKQYFDLDDCLTAIKGLLGKGDNQSLWPIKNYLIKHITTI